MLSKKLIEELQLILKEEFNIDMTYKETSKFGTWLRDFYKTLVKLDRNTKKNK